MHLHDPQALLWTASAVVFGLIAYVLVRHREKLLRRMIDANMLPVMLPPKRRARRLCALGLRLAAISLGLIAFARPQWGEKLVEARHMGLDILVALDTSNSMLAEDIRPNRLERAKLGVRDLVGHLRGDRIGLIPFAGGSYLYCPLTSDYAAFMMMLDDIHAGIIPRGGTAIEQALRRAANTFDDHLLADRVIILITDGEDHEGNPLAALDELRGRNIRVFVVGVGSPEGDLIPVSDKNGRLTFMRDREGNLVRSRLHEDVLERLATRTGGMYVRADPSDFGLERIYRQGIAPLQRDTLETETIRTREDRFVWLLALALLLLTIEAFVEGGIRMRFPRRRHADAASAVLIFLLAVANASRLNAGAPQASMQRGLRAYQREQFDEAAESFRQAAEEARETQRLDPARALFNYANALIAQGRYDEAAGVYAEALRSTDLDVQQAAHYNRGHALLSAAAGLAREQNIEGAKALTEEALESYRNALALDPRDYDAKVNYELTDRFRDELELMLEQMPPPQPEPQAGDAEDEEEDGRDDAFEQPPAHEHPDVADEQDSRPEDREGAVDPDQRDESTQAASIDEMTEEEALMLLDILRDEEQKVREQTQLDLGPPETVGKDW